MNFLMFMVLHVSTAEIDFNHMYSKFINKLELDLEDFHVKHQDDDEVVKFKSDKN